LNGQQERCPSTTQIHSTAPNPVSVEVPKLLGSRGLPYRPNAYYGIIGSSLSGTGNTPATFTGTSSYSKDFQNVISRAVAIASLPVNLLTGQQNALTSQSNELSTLDTKFTALQSAVQGIQQALS